MMNDKLAERPKKKRSRNQSIFANPTPISPVQSDACTLYILGYPNEVLGVFSTLDTATLAARVFGALESTLVRWNDDGLREYLGKLLILPKKIERDETPNDNGGKEKKPDEKFMSESAKNMQTVYMAMDKGLRLGVCTKKSSAWSVCMKHKMHITYSVDLKGERRWIDEEGMPYLTGSIRGGGTHCWYVQPFTIDKLARGSGRE